jgi:hypothetical protein
MHKKLSLDLYIDNWDDWFEDKFSPKEELVSEESSQKKESKISEKSSKKKESGTESGDRRESSDSRCTSEDDDHVPDILRP